LQQGLELGDDRDRVYSILGIAYGSIGSYEEAQAIMEEGLDIYPDSVLLHLGLGGLFADMEDCEQAIVEFEWVLDEEPDNALALQYWEECDAILNPQPTPMPAPTRPPSAATPGAISQQRAEKLATDLIEGLGATLDLQMFQTEEGETYWYVLYTSQHLLTSEQIGTQQRRIVLGLSKILIRIDPPVDGLGVIAYDANDETYNMVIVVSFIAQAWADGDYTDDEFVDWWVIIEP
jgi:tetratricopeptide (TPR) repeat protein